MHHIVRLFPCGLLCALTDGLLMTLWPEHMSVQQVNRATGKHERLFTSSCDYAQIRLSYPVRAAVFECFIFPLLAFVLYVWVRVVQNKDCTVSACVCFSFLHLKKKKSLWIKGGYSVSCCNQRNAVQIIFRFMFVQYRNKA